MNLMDIVSIEVKALLKQNGLPCPTSEVGISIPTLKDYTKDQLKEDLDGINNKALYIIWTPEAPCTYGESYAIIKANNPYTSRINPSEHWHKNLQTGNYCLYVGVSRGDLKLRLRQHFSLCSQGKTYSLWMQSWRRVPSPLFVSVFGFESTDSFDGIKNALWYHYQPLLGNPDSQKGIRGARSSSHLRYAIAAGAAQSVAAHSLSSNRVTLGAHIDAKAKHPSSVDSATGISLEQQFETELDTYLNEQIARGFSGATRVASRTLQNALRLAGGASTSTLYVLQKKGIAQYSIEALCLKKKYEGLIPHTVRATAAYKLASVGFDVTTLTKEVY